MKYSEQLLTDKWKNKRLIILKRDNYCCKKCNSKNNLQVHHKKYINGRMCWDYPNSFLITLCKICHDKLHKETKIEVIKDKKTKTKDKKITKKQKRYKKLYPNMYNFYESVKKDK